MIEQETPLQSFFAALLFFIFLTLLAFAPTAL